MNPWLRELVRTLAAIAVEDALAREGRVDTIAREPRNLTEPTQVPVGGRTESSETELPLYY
jgi:hypothetical protein